MKSKRKVETAMVDSMKSAEAFMDWCECNDHKVIEIAVTYEDDGLAREDDGAKVLYVDTSLAEKEPVSISRIARDYGIGVGGLYRILRADGFLAAGKFLEFALGPAYIDSDEDDYFVRTEKVLRIGGDVRMVRMTRFTRRARLEIHTLLTERGIEPVMDREL